MPQPTTDPTPRPATAAERQEQLMHQLVGLTASVESLARRPTVATVDQQSPPSVDVTRTQFAYAMLGGLLGRRGPRFTIDRIDVEQGQANGVRTLTFRSLAGGTTAHLAARDGSSHVLTGLVDNQRPVATTVPGDVEIDIVVLLADGGLAVGVALCPDPQRLEP